MDFLIINFHEQEFKRYSVFMYYLFLINGILTFYNRVNTSLFIGESSYHQCSKRFRH